MQLCYYKKDRKVILQEIIHLVLIWQFDHHKLTE